MPVLIHLINSTYEQRLDLVNFGLYVIESSGYINRIHFVDQSLLDYETKYENRNEIVLVYNEDPVTTKDLVNYTIDCEGLDSNDIEIAIYELVPDVCASPECTVHKIFRRYNRRKKESKISLQDNINKIMSETVRALLLQFSEDEVQNMIPDIQKLIKKEYMDYYEDYI